MPGIISIVCTRCQPPCSFPFTKFPPPEVGKIAAETWDNWVDEWDKKGHAALIPVRQEATVRALADLRLVLADPLVVGEGFEESSQA